MAAASMLLFVNYCCQPNCRASIAADAVALGWAHWRWPYSAAPATVDNPFSCVAANCHAREFVFVHFSTKLRAIAVRGLPLSISLSFATRALSYRRTRRAARISSKN